MKIQVDTWGGDLHQRHVSQNTFETWEAASEFMRLRIDEGHLCNVLDADFKAPPGRAEEAEAAMLKQLME